MLARALPAARAHRRLGALRSATDKSFWYFGTLMFTLTLVLIYYLNFKYGHSQCLALGNPPDVNCEVRDRDYFFIWSFSAWGVWAALGLSTSGNRSRRSSAANEVKIGRETVEVPRATRRG